MCCFWIGTLGQKFSQFNSLILDNGHSFTLHSCIVYRCNITSWSVLKYESHKITLSGITCCSSCNKCHYFICHSWFWSEPQSFVLVSEDRFPHERVQSEYRTAKWSCLFWQIVVHRWGLLLFHSSICIHNYDLHKKVDRMVEHHSTSLSPVKFLIVFAVKRWHWSTPSQ